MKSDSELERDVKEELRFSCFECMTRRGGALINM